MGSWLLKLPSRDTKTKIKNKKKTNKQNKKHQETKTNGKYNTCHEPLSQEWIDWRYQSSI